MGSDPGGYLPKGVHLVKYGIFLYICPVVFPRVMKLVVVSTWKKKASKEHFFTYSQTMWMWTTL